MGGSPSPPPIPDAPAMRCCLSAATRARHFFHLSHPSFRTQAEDMQRAWAATTIQCRVRACLASHETRRLRGCLAVQRAWRRRVARRDRERARASKRVEARLRSHVAASRLQEAWRGRNSKAYVRMARLLREATDGWSREAGERGGRGRKKGRKGDDDPTASFDALPSRSESVAGVGVGEATSGPGAEAMKSVRWVVGELADLQVATRCVVCWKAPRCMLASPCRHIVLCRECARRSARCCVCRVPIESWTRVYE